MVTWTILIATLAQRGDRFKRLLDVLLPQLEPYDGVVTVSALWNVGDRKLGEIRHALVRDASSDYVCFIDDDDVVPNYYVERVMGQIDGKPGIDYVGWRMQCYVDGRPLRPTYHSIRYQRWHHDRRGYYRHVSHLNPIRAELARRGDFRRSWPEDYSWAEQVYPHVRTEGYVDDVMYHYYSSTTDTVQRPGLVRDGSFVRPSVDSIYFSYHAESDS